MATLVKTKVSTVVPKQVPEFVRSDHQTFVTFLQAYYDWLDQEFKPGYYSNRLESTRDIDETLDQFVDYIKNEVMLNIPQNILVDKRYLAKHIYDMHRAKGTIRSYEMLFRVLFNETPELYFPKVDMLRVSDGDWDSRTIIRCVEVEGDSFNIVGQTITQPNDSVNELIGDDDDPAVDLATAKVEAVIKFPIGDQLISEITLSDNSVVGTFVSGQILNAIDNTDPTRTVRIRIISIVNQFNVIDGGKYYEVGQPVTIRGGSGLNAVAQIGGIKSGPVTGIYVDNPGTGYRVGDEIVFDNTDTNGTGAVAVVTAIRTDGIILEELELGTLDTSDVTLDTEGTIDAEYFIETQPEYLLTERGGKILTESGATGGILSVQILSGGSNYNKPPKVSVSSTTGSGAKLIAIGEDIGRVTKIDVINFGAEYDSPPIGITPVNLYYREISGSFITSERLIVDDEVILNENGEDLILLEDGSRMLIEAQSTPTGTLESLDTDTNRMVINPASERLTLVSEDGNSLITENENSLVTEDSGEFSRNQTLIGVISGARARIIDMEHCHIQAVSGSVGETVGSFITADGKISEPSKKIQDSFFYQDYSYVIKVGQSIDRYRDIVKKVLHPIGLALFGEVRIQSLAGRPMTATSGFVDLMRSILLLIDLKIRSFNKTYTIIVQDFVELALGVRVQTSEFLPTIIFPRVTPYELHLLELSPEVIPTSKELELYKGFGAFALAVVHNSTEIDVYSSSEPVAHTLAWLEKYKFTFQPYEAGTKGIGWNTPAFNQGSTLAGNTQIKDFANFTVYDVINNPDRRIPFTYEALITIESSVFPVRVDEDDRFMDDTTLLMDSGGESMDLTSILSDSTVYSMDTE